MSETIEHVRMRERIRVAYLRHRGDVGKIARELGISYNYVYKTVNKIREKESRDSHLLITHTIAHHILAGHDSRIQHYQDLLEKLNHRVLRTMSLCCNAPATYHVTDSVTRYYCDKCSQEASVREVTDVDVIKLRQDVLKDMREESRMLADFVLNMRKMKFLETGRGAGPDTPPSAPARPQGVSTFEKDNPQLAAEIRSMTPGMRAELLDRLESRVTDLAAVEAELVESDQPNNQPKENT